MELSDLFKNVALCLFSLENLIRIKSTSFIVKVATELKLDGAILSHKDSKLDCIRRPLTLFSTQEKPRKFSQIDISLCHVNIRLFYF